jgi:TolA-binding protein
MKMTSFHYLVISALFLLAACTSPKEKALENITHLESSDSIFNPEHMESLKNAYTEYASKYPDDEKAPEFMFRAAQRCNVLGQHAEAISLLEDVGKKYPKHKLAEDALFLEAYVYENSLHDMGKAKLAYQSFLEKYPNSEMADDAKQSMNFLGKSPEEILNAIQKQEEKAMKP